ncbi:MAG: hypothetical protein WD872_00165 [Pirellulaceae bacterium]
MQTYETSATVEIAGEIHIAGVPFPPGTRVEVTIHATRQTTAGGGQQFADLVHQLCAALDKGRNSQSIGQLRREELYDRDCLH